MKKRISILAGLFAFFVINLKASGPADLPEIASVDREQQQLQWCFHYSNILGYNIAYINNPRLFQTVSEWLGTPYKFSGNSKSGVDCSGFICEVYRDCFNKVMTGSARDIYNVAEKLRKADLREGDLVFFKINKNRVSHVGVYLGQNKFVHASSSHGVTVSDLEDPYYVKCFFKGGRIKL